MRTLGIWSGSLLAVLMLVVGCGAQPGKTVISYDRGKTPPPMAMASQNGTYALYASDGVNPIYSQRLDKGDEYGFAQSASGNHVVGVVKGKEIPLEATLATGYYWKLQKDR